MSDHCFGIPGVWLEGSDGTDINALCRSHSQKMVAVADDFCKVHLFQYPCPKPKVPLLQASLTLLVDLTVNGAFHYISKSNLFLSS